MSLTKSQLAGMLSENIGLCESDAKDLVATFYQEICLALASGDSVSLAGFGIFKRRDGVVAFMASETLK